MPEFRLRRKKKEKGQRRHTVQNDVELSQKLTEASLHFQEHSEIIMGPNEISIDDAVQGRARHKEKTPENARGIISSPSSLEPLVKATTNRTIASKYSDCIYLRYGADIRRCPLPSPITLSTIKHLFINLFDLHHSINKDPAWHLFILDRSNSWKPLDDISLIHDQCSVLIINSNDVGSMIPSTSPVHFRSSTGTPTDEAEDDDQNGITSMTNHTGSFHSDDNVVQVIDTPTFVEITPLTQADNKVTPTQPSRSEDKELIENLKKEIAELKASHQLQILHLQQELNLAKLSANENENVSTFRHERISIDCLKDNYLTECESLTKEVSFLENIGEELKVDAIKHKCKVDAEEVKVLLSMATYCATVLTKLKDNYHLLEERLKPIMQKELEVVVSEEKLIAEEPQKLSKMSESCHNIVQIFTTLQQLSTLQEQLPPQIPVIVTTEDPNRKEVIANINMIQPEHEKRMEAIKSAENIIYERKKQLSPSRRALQQFELALQTKQKQLKTTNAIDSLEKERESKVKCLYLDERQERQKEVEKEVQLSRKALEEKRKKEIADAERRLNLEPLPPSLPPRNTEDKNEVKRERKESNELRKLERDGNEQKRLEKEKRKLEEERVRQLEERRRLDELREKQEEQHQLLKEEQRRQNDERRRIDMERFQQKEELRRLEQNQKRWEEYHIQLNSNSPNTKNRRKELLWNNVQHEIHDMNAGHRYPSDLTRGNSLAMSGSDSSLASVRRNGAAVHFSEIDNGIPMAPVSQNFSSHHNLSIVQSSEMTRRKPDNERYRPPLVDNLQKFNSEDSLVKQNLYDLPWTSKKYLLPAPKKEAIRSSFHRRHKSDVHEISLPSSLNQMPNELTASSPLQSQLLNSAMNKHIVSSKSLSLSREHSFSTNPHFKSQEDERFQQSSYQRYTPPLPQPLRPNSRHSPSTAHTVPAPLNGPPTYTQAMTVGYPYNNDSYRPRSNTVGSSHYPITNYNKPSISLV